MSRIHPTAIVDPAAEIDPSVTIGAYSIIKGPVKIGADTIIHEHTHLHGMTTIGKKCEIGPTTFVGLRPQHLRADPDIGSLVIGDRTVLRELVSVHRSTHAGEDHATRIGNDCFFMAGCHVGHDSVVEDGVVIVNHALIAGHCHIGAKAFIGGGCGVHQFCRVGRLAIVGGAEAVAQEVPPFGAFRQMGLRGYNAVGCRRAGMSRESIAQIRKAYTIIHELRSMPKVLAAIEALTPRVAEVDELLLFLRTSKRGIARSASRAAVADSE